MSENIVLDGFFYDGSTKEEHDFIKNSYPNNDIWVHMIRPGEAHITIYEKETLRKDD